jgi:hypothetical protein
MSEVPLPFPEQKLPLSAQDVAVKRVVGGWEVWAGQRVLRNTGDSEGNARDVAAVLRDLRPTDWVTIGGTRPVVEYGLTNGRPIVTGAQPESKDGTNGGAVAQAGGAFGGPTAAGTAAKFVQPIDLRSARVEAIRGAWVVRDDSNILLNFGPDKAGAEQAGAVIQRYGFNRVGVVGTPTQPAMSYLFVSLDPVKPQPGGGLLLQAQIDGLTRTGVPVPGVGFVGEMVKIDARKVEVRKDGAEWVVAFGLEVLGRFGPLEWSAREAARVIQDGRFTEFCKLGGESAVTFFLINGKAPTRAPFNAQGRNFDSTALKVQPLNSRWRSRRRRQLLELGARRRRDRGPGAAAYGFDQTAHLSPAGRKADHVLREDGGRSRSSRLCGEARRPWATRICASKRRSRRYVSPRPSGLAAKPARPRPTFTTRAGCATGQPPVTRLGGGGVSRPSRRPALAVDGAAHRARERPAGRADLQLVQRVAVEHDERRLGAQARLERPVPRPQPVRHRHRVTSCWERTDSAYYSG